MGNPPVARAGRAWKKKIKKVKKVVDIYLPLPYNITCVTERRRGNTSGCGSVWLEHLVWDQGVAGSNPVFPTIYKNWGHSSAGRAPALHAGGQRFDPAWLHQ